MIVEDMIMDQEDTIMDMVTIMVDTIMEVMDTQKSQKHTVMKDITTELEDAVDTAILMITSIMMNTQKSNQRIKLNKNMPKLRKI
tara:strand:- start:98 stop:352 length:255 start_codon:yes stop_codon:yes gene_type:complete